MIWSMLPVTRFHDVRGICFNLLGEPLRPRQEDINNARNISNRIQGWLVLWVSILRDLLSDGDLVTRSFDPF